MANIFSSSFLGGSGGSFDIGSATSGFASLAGTGLSLDAALGQASAQAASAKESQNQAMLEMQADTQRRTAMELTARRQQLQTIRNQQMARSMALTTATSQGAAYGESSGLRGAYASIADQSATNQRNVSENLQVGEHLFDINAQIDASKMQQAKDQAGASMFAGLGAIGKAIGGAAGSLGSFAQFAPLLLAA